MTLTKFFQRVASKRDRSSSPTPSNRSRSTTPQTTPSLPCSPYLHGQYFDFGESSATSAASSSTSTSTSSSTSLDHAISNLRVEEQAPVFRPTVRLLACVDAISDEAVAQGIPSDPFWVELDLEDDVSSTARAIENVLALSGDFAVGNCFKVSIPRHAQQQAVTFKHMYGQSVDLVTHFESYNLNDPKQIHASLGEGLSPYNSREEAGLSSPLTVGHCWPVERRMVGDEMISILVRLGKVQTCLKPSMTALAYFSKPGDGPTIITTPCSPNPNQQPSFGAPESPEPPVAIEVPLDCTVMELKRIILKADGRPVGALDKCVIWSVDMSWKEMRSCEAFGGLRDAGMPWPYPPTSNPPIKLADGNAPVAKFLPSMVSNPNLVTFYIHIDRALTGILANHKATLEHLNEQPTPNFHYPMDFPDPSRPLETPLRRNSICRQHSYSPPSSPALDRQVLKPASRRARPSTAPVGRSMGRIDTPGVPAFGARSSKLKREPSGLGFGRSTPPDSHVGLGIAS